ncbi:hypothetical protein ACOMHN_036917 [Nucella lapillus]
MYDVVAVLGSSTSDQSITATWLMGRSQVPMVSVLATSDDLNNPKRFPYFLRVVPPDRHQFRAIAELIKTFAWTYVSVLYEESSYGENAFRLLREYLDANNTCLAVAEKIGRETEEKVRHPAKGPPASSGWDAQLGTSMSPMEEERTARCVSLRLSRLKHGPTWDLRAYAPLHVRVWRGSASRYEVSSFVNDALLEIRLRPFILVPSTYGVLNHCPLSGHAVDQS